MLCYAPLLSYPLNAPPIAATGLGPVPFFLSDRPFITEPDDPDLPNQPWKPRLGSALNIERTLPLSPLDQRRAVLQVGSIEIVNADGKYDQLVTSMPVDGQRVEVSAVAPGFRYRQRLPIFVGTGSGWRGGDANTVYLDLRDGSWELDAPAQPDRYGGSGGLDGGADLTGKPKPYCYGFCRDVAPVPVDQAREIYQVHFSATQTVVACYDMGEALTYAGDVADIEAATPAIGSFVTELKRGYIRLGSPPRGIVTATVMGDRSNGRYVDTVAGIAFRLVHDRAGWTDDRFNLKTFTRVRALQPATVGIYTGLEDPSFADMLNTLTAGAGCWWGQNFLDQMELGRLDFASTKADFYLDSKHVIDVTPIEPPDTVNPPFWQVKIGCQRRWTDLGGQLATGLDPDRRAFLSQEYRYPTPAQSGDVRTKHLRAQQMTLNGLFENLADGAKEQARQLALNAERPSLARISLKLPGYRIPLQSTVHIELARFGFNGGANAFVYGQGLQADTLSSFIDVRY